MCEFNSDICRASRINIKIHWKCEFETFTKENENTRGQDLLSKLFGMPGWRPDCFRGSVHEPGK